MSRGSTRSRGHIRHNVCQDTGAIFGEKEEEAQPNVGDLLEPKEELLSADEEDGEEDPEAEEDAEGELLTEEKPLKPNESQPQSHWTTADEDPGRGSVVPKEEAEEVQHPRDKEGPAAGGASDAAANTNGHCKSSVRTHNKNNPDDEEDAEADAENAEEEPEDMDLDGDLLSLSGEEDYNDEELQSLDSFYSGERFVTYAPHSLAPTQSSHIFPFHTAHSMRAQAITIEIAVQAINTKPGPTVPVPVPVDIDAEPGRRRQQSESSGDLYL
ncbi:retinitis pigmentosa 1-like 1 protein [Drosophila miranda]|uniref:retinitis pigmentosa 1-like 1 protein n=1 Tax=Drosophila miranda TaxID=7229 RepID=UPI00143F7D27|nr:retinitis pigmentosa 1-like 1 protein [Drosophila miranda]